MAFQPVPNAALITITADLDGERCVNTLGFGKVVPGPVTASELQAITDAVATRWEANFLLHLPSQYVMQLVSGRVLDVEDGPVAESNTGIGTPGELVGNILPNNCSLVTSFKTGLAGRTNRGRNYWPSLLENEVTGQLVFQAKANNILVLYDGLIGANEVAPGWQWCVISRKQLVPGGPGRAVPITSVIHHDLVIDSARRRLPGRGD